jgi:hypothetical protein
VRIVKNGEVSFCKSYRFLTPLLKKIHYIIWYKCCIFFRNDSDFSSFWHSARVIKDAVIMVHFIGIIPYGVLYIYQNLMVSCTYICILWCLVHILVSSMGGAVWGKKVAPSKKTYVKVVSCMMQKS